LTKKGKKVVSDALDLNAARLQDVMHDLSPKELDVLQQLLRRLGEDFVQ